MARKWQRNHFLDHPDLGLGLPSRNPSAYQSAKARVVCEQCFNAHARSIKAQDLGAGQAPRDDEVIKRAVFSLSREEDKLWITARTDNLTNHLIQCPYQPENVKEKAREWKQGSRSSSRSQHPFPSSSNTPLRPSTALFAATNFPLSWLKNPEVETLFQAFDPQARLPARGTLTRRIIPNTLQQMRLGSRQHLQGLSGTLQCDGWTGINFVHVIAFMLAVEKQVYAVRVYDASLVRKTERATHRSLQEETELFDLIDGEDIQVATDGEAVNIDDRAQALLDRYII